MRKPIRWNVRMGAAVVITCALSCERLPSEVAPAAAERMLPARSGSPRGEEDRGEEDRGEEDRGDGDAAALASATAPAAAVASAAAPLWVAGDVLLSEAVRDAMHAQTDPAAAYARVLSPVASLWNADRNSFVLINLETPVADRRRRAIDSAPRTARGLSPVYLHGPPWLPEALARAGVDAVMLANNHALDQERQGLTETIAAARRAGLVVTGAGVPPAHRWPIVLGAEGQSVAVLTFYDAHDKGWVDAGEAARSFLDDDAYRRIQQADAAHAHVVVVVHFVGELREEPLQRWRERVQRAIDSGADVVLAHGTHVPMPVEWIGSVPVAWGLGNFVADMARQASPRRRGNDLAKIQSPKTREGLIARVAWSIDGDLDFRLLPIWNGDDRFVRWHAHLAGEEIGFWVWPMAPCTVVTDPASTASSPRASPVALPDTWPQPWRGELATWITERRDHLVRITGLIADCTDPSNRWLTLPPR